MTSPHASHRTGQLLWLVLLAAFALRALTIPRESLWRDEVDTIRFALAPLAFQDVLGAFGLSEFNGPLYTLLMRGWFSLAGISDFTLRYVSLVCGVLLAGVIGALGRALYGPRAGLAAAALTALAPVEVWYSGEGKMYTLQPLLLATAILALWVACRRTARRRPARRAWLIFAAATSLSYYTHLLSPLFVAVALAMAAAWGGRSVLRSRGGLAAFAAITLPYAPLVMWQLPGLVNGRDTGHPHYALDTVGSVLALNWTYGLHSVLPLGWPADGVWWAISLFWSVAAAAALAALVLSGNRAHALRRAAPLLVWLLLPALLVQLISLRAAVFEPRYVLWCAPALYVLTGAAVAGLPSSTWRAACALTLGAVFGLGNLAQWSIPIRPDLRGAAGFMSTQVRAQDAVIYQIPYARYSFEHYGVRAPTDMDGPYTNNGAAPEQVGATLAGGLGRAQRVWLVESEPALWDARGLTRQWLDQNWRVALRRPFFDVDVALYERR